MSEIVNLNRFRKARNRIKKRAEADENAVKFGLSKSERMLDESRAEKAREVLRQHRLDEE
ncbi:MULTISPECIES: DUF4169 family protein [unclassified Roseovarius]|uniref:DUF4169 family protein n=1 Tax=unclassified Roseovarius TaxID=2614913 RepID=UPI00273F26F3|nr:DUF4169 family protein [Roseovarius sp. MMSF_3350]